MLEEEAKQKLRDWINNQLEQHSDEVAQLLHSDPSLLAIYPTSDDDIILDVLSHDYCLTVGVRVY